MKPFYQNARITLYCGDSLEVLASLMADGIHFDLMLTDPPYGLNQKENKPSGVNAQRAKGAYKDDLFSDTEEYLNAKVRPVIDIGLAISDLGIVTGGVGSWKYLPPPKRKVACTRPPRRHSTHGDTRTTGRFIITASRTGIAGNTASCRT